MLTNIPLQFLLITILLLNYVCISQANENIDNFIILQEDNNNNNINVEFEKNNVLRRVEIGLKQQNLEKLQTLARRVSDPSNRNYYGKYFFVSLLSRSDPDIDSKNYLNYD